MRTTCLTLRRAADDSETFNLKRLTAPSMRRDPACSSEAALSTFDMTRESKGQIELANTFFLTLSASPWVLEADNADENRTFSVVMLVYSRPDIWLRANLVRRPLAGTAVLLILRLIRLSASLLHRTFCFVFERKWSCDEKKKKDTK